MPVNPTMNWKRYDNYAYIQGTIASDPKDVVVFGQTCKTFMLEFLNDNTKPATDTDNLGLVLCLTNEDSAIQKLNTDFAKGDIVSLGKNIHEQHQGAGFITYLPDKLLPNNPSMNCIGFEYIEGSSQACLQLFKNEASLHGVLAYNPHFYIDKNRNEFCVIRLEYPPCNYSPLCDDSIPNIITCATHELKAINAIKSKNLTSGDYVKVNGLLKSSDYAFGSETKIFGIDFDFIA